MYDGCGMSNVGGRAGIDELIWAASGFGSGGELEGSGLHGEAERLSGNSLSNIGGLADIDVLIWAASGFGGEGELEGSGEHSLSNAGGLADIDELIWAASGFGGGGELEGSGYHEGPKRVSGNLRARSCSRSVMLLRCSISSEMSVHPESSNAGTPVYLWSDQHRNDKLFNRTYRDVPSGGERLPASVAR